MSNMEQMRNTFTSLLLEGDIEETIRWAEGTLDSGVRAMDFFDQVFTPSMVAVGDMFGRLDIFLPELMDAAENAKAVSERVLQPIFAAQETEFEISRGKIVICSVQGDLHDIGKNMVALMLQVNGFEVIDLGIDVPPRRAIQRAKEEQADLIGLSSLMTTSMPYMKECIELRDGFGLKDNIKIIVGGAPITPEYSQQIGADAFGRDAVEAVQKCINLITIMKQEGAKSQNKNLKPGSLT